MKGGMMPNKKELSYNKVKPSTMDDLCWIRRVVVDLYEGDHVITEPECMGILDSLFEEQSK